MDISDPEAPVIIGTVEVTGDSHEIEANVGAVAVSNDLVYAATWWTRQGQDLQILAAECEAVSALGGDLETSMPLPSLRAIPNPGADGTTLHLESARSGQVRLAIFDPGGRLVRALCHESLRAGGHDMYWDGRDESGRPVPSGAYLARAWTAAGTRTSRIVIAR